MKSDQSKTKAELIKELQTLRRKVDNVTGTVRTEREVSGVEQILQKQLAAIETSMDGISLSNEKGEFIYVNPAHAKIYGFDDPAELLGKTWQVHSDQEEQQRFEREVVPILMENGKWQGEATGIKRNGDKFPVELSISLTPQGWSTCVARDISKRKQAEKELRLAHAFSHKLVTSSLDNIVAVDKNEKIVEFNLAAQNMFGYNREEILGQHLEILHKSHADSSSIIKAVKENNKYLGETVNIKKNGETFQTWISASILLDGQDNYNGAVIIYRDISDWVKTHQALQESEERFRTLFENAPEAITLVDNECNVLQINKEFTRIFGFTQDEIIGRCIDDVITNDETREEAKAISKRILGGETVSLEVVRQHKDGNPLQLSILGKPIEIDGKQIASYGIYRDITQRKLVEKDITHRAELEMLIADISSKLVIQSFEEIDTTINEAIAKIGAFSGADRAYVFRLYNNGSSMTNTHEWCAEGIEPQIENLKNLSVNVFPWWMDRLNRFENIHIPRVRDLPPEASAEKEILQDQDIQSLIVVPMIVQGKLTGFIGFDAVRRERKWSEEDIIMLRLMGETIAVALKHKQSLSKIKESEESYHGLYNHATDAIYVLNREGRFIDVNEGAVNMYGYPKEYFVGKTPEPLAAPGKNDMALIPKYVERAFAGEPVQFEFWGKRKNGEEFPKIVRLNKGQYFGEEVIFAFALDITNTKQAEERLKLSEKKYRDLFENANDVILIIDPETEIILEANRLVEQIYGYGRNELVGMSIKELSHNIKLDQNYVDQLLSKGSIDNFETVHKKKDGTQINVLVNASFIEYEGRKVILSLHRDITERKEIEEELILSLRELELLDDVRKAVLSGQPVEEVVGKIVSSLSELCGTQAISIYIYNKDQNRLVLQNLGLKKSIIDRIEKLAHVNLRDYAPILRTGYRYYEALRTGKGFIESDSDKIENLFCEFTDSKILHGLIKSVMKLIHIDTVGVLPMVTSSGPVGIITFNTKEKIESRSLRRLEHFSREIALSIENAVLFDTINRERQKLELIVDGIGGGLSLIDTNYNILWANKYFTDNYGPVEDLVGKPCYTVYFGRDQVCEVCACRESIRSGQVEIKEVMMSNGEQKWFQQTSAPIRDTSGKVVQLLEFVQDITERKLVEEKLRESEEKYRNLFQSKSHAAILTDAQTLLFEDANQVALDMFGYHREEFLHLSPWDITAEKKESIKALSKLQKSKTGTWHVPQRTFIRKDGTTFVGEAYTGILSIGGREKILSLVHDITQRIRIEEKLKRHLKESVILNEITTAVTQSMSFKSRLDIILDKALEIVGANAGIIFLVDHEEQKLSVAVHRGLSQEYIDEYKSKEIDFGEGLTGRVAASGKPIIIETDASKDSRIVRKAAADENVNSYIGFPIKSKGKILGVMNIVTRPPDMLNREDLTILTTIGNAVGATLENAQLFEEVNLERQKLDKIVGGIGGGLSLIGTNYRILWANKYLIDNYGSLNDLIGKPCYEVYLGRDKICEVCPSYESMKSGKVTIEEKMVTNGETKWYLQTSAPIKDTTGNVVQVLELFQDITERKQVEMEILRQRKELSYLSTQLVNAQEAERKRISQELHDELGQLLTAVSINLEELKETTKSSLTPPLEKRLEETISLIDKADEQITDLSFQLRPMMLDELGLKATMQWFLNKFSDRVNIEVQFKGESFDQRLPSEIEITLFRIMQEATTNIARHAQASQIKISLGVENSIVQMIIQDNGQGFNIKESSARDVKYRGMGIISMQERVRSLKGVWKIHSSPGKGTQIEVQLPVRTLS
ncbi:MAG: PAS domain S-box protein [Fidelibacterota bacterium]